MAKHVINDKKIFESVTTDNPIEIAMKRSDNGTYTMIMLISDKGNNLLHKSLNFLVWLECNVFNKPGFSQFGRSGLLKGSPVKTGY